MSFPSCKIINCIRGSALIHRQFIDFLIEVQADFHEILYFCNVRWLSRGKMLNRFVLLFTEIQNFLLEKDMYDVFPEIWEEEWTLDLYFLSDISNHLNELNLSIQGKDKLISELSKSVKEFQLKLELFIEQLENYDFNHFPNLSVLATISEINCAVYIEWLQHLLNQLKLRFADFDRWTTVFHFMEDPYNFPIENVYLLSAKLRTSRRNIELDLIKIKSSAANKRHENERTVDMWRRIFIINQLEIINKDILHMFSMFGSTWICESTFSVMKNIKTDLRSRIADDNLEAEIRCKVSAFEPNVRKLVKEINCQSSH